MQRVEWRGRDLLFTVHASPGASHDEIAGWHDDALKVRIAAPPAGGRANERLLRVLAGAFGVPSSGVRLLSGGGGRRKRVAVASPRRIPECFGNAVADTRSNH